MTDKQEAFLRRLATTAAVGFMNEPDLQYWELDEAGLLKLKWIEKERRWRARITLAGRNTLENIDTRREAERRERELRAVLERERDEALKREAASRRRSDWIAIAAVVATSLAAIVSPIVSWKLGLISSTSRCQCERKHDDRHAPEHDPGGREHREAKQKLVEKLAPRDLVPGSVLPEPALHGPESQGEEGQDLKEKPQADAATADKQDG